MKKLLLLLLSLPLMSNDTDSIYLDCGQPKFGFQKQELFLKIIPNKYIELLDGNLKWRKYNYQTVDLDSYFSGGPSSTYYDLERDTLKLKILKNSTKYDYSCLVISEDRILEEIDVILNKKKSNQKI